MLAGCITGFALPRLRLALPQHVTGLAGALADAAPPRLPKGKMRQFYLGHGNTDQVFTLAADQAVIGHIFAQVLFDTTTHDFTKRAVS